MTQQTTQSPATFFDLYLSDKSVAWVVGTQGSIFQTLNGGKTWVDRTLPCGAPCIKPPDLVKIQFPDKLQGWIIGERGVLLFTQDAGFTWKEPEPIAKGSLYGLSFSDAANGWAVGDHGTVIQLSPSP